MKSNCKEWVYLYIHVTNHLDKCICILTSVICYSCLSASRASHARGRLQFTLTRVPVPFDLNCFSVFLVSSFTARCVASVCEWHSTVTCWPTGQWARASLSPFGVTQEHLNTSPSLAFREVDGNIAQWKAVERDTRENLFETIHLLPREMEKSQPDEWINNKRHK